MYSNDNREDNEDNKDLAMAIEINQVPNPFTNAVRPDETEVFVNNTEFGDTSSETSTPLITRSVADAKSSESPNCTIDSYDQQKVYNNWTKVNIDTVRKMTNEIKESSRIYEIVKEKNTIILQKVLIWILVLNTVHTVISATQGAILVSDPENVVTVWIGSCMSIVIFIIGGINTFLSGAVSIYQWDKVVNTYTTYINKLDHLNVALRAEMLKSHKLRTDANAFIIKHAEDYMKICQECPDMKSSDYTNAKKQCGQILDDSAINTRGRRRKQSNPDVNYKSSQKYSCAFGSSDEYL